jgi:hypothetical protein
VAKRGKSGGAPPRPPTQKAAAESGRARKPAAERGTEAPTRRGPPRTAPESGRQSPRDDSGERPPAPAVPSSSLPDRLGTGAKQLAQSGNSYHRWILAEFVGSLVLAVVGAVVAPKKRADGLVTFAGLLVQMTALALVFFVLSLTSAGRRTGKIAAAFGFLIALGVLLNSTEAIKALTALFAPPKKTKGGK